ncbi:hypothetical protein [Candidatus Parabeggiatoa sp. HSG14]|uniref:RipA family octameric membrane protein n=1 Tax=Candidatus Parabeggiatoa sp. HSG14 TaxID=3055593 RepID=UPI0025A6DC6C|nr:hypothetical protein [Thiotrichales bacterium HSG14]
MEKEPIPTTLAELVHYYEVRMMALTGYSTQIWNRFNWFLTLELAIFGFFFTRLGALPPNSAVIVPIIGVVIAVLWTLIGSEDYISMKRHGQATTGVEKEIRKTFYEQGIDFNNQIKKSFIKFRQTWILFLFPVIVTISWLFFIFWYFN